ncbi:MAG: TolC family protein [Desulfobacca sp.]|uniref:TolC family protein n=1 Tax=Desulfobacca sp. TaxID=2067990 RepID=UPI00404B85AB
MSIASCCAKARRGGSLRLTALSRALILIFLFFGWVPCPAHGQNPGAGQRLTLEEAIATALANHPAIQEFKSRSQAARAQIGVSRANLLPKVTHTSSYYYGTSLPTSSLAVPSGFGQFGGTRGQINDFTVHQFQANQLLYDFGKTLGQVGQSRALYEAASMDLQNIRQQVVLDAKTAFFGYLAAERAVTVSEENLRLNEELVRQAKGFYDVGVRARIDVTTAEANLYTAQADLITARNNLQIAQVALMTALGLKSWPYTGLSFQVDTRPKPVNLQEAKEKAWRDRPDLARNRYQQEADRQAVRTARAGYFPTLYAQGAQNTQGKPYGDMRGTWSLSLNASVPIFEGLATRYSVQQAKENLRATEANAEVLRQDINKQVEQSYLNIRAAAERIRAAAKGQEAARENWDLARGRYNAGVGSIIEVTDAQVKYFNAELTYIRAVYDLKVAEAQLEKAMGVAY